MNDAVSSPLQLLKELDRAQYLASLYLPEICREDIAGLRAFDAEIGKIPSLVSEPMPGEIRLQWWRDLLASGDNVGSGPLAKAFMATINKHNLPRETFVACLDARIFDLYSDPMPDMGSFEGYMGETVSVMLQNYSICAGATRDPLLADICGHAGMAIGTARILSGLPLHRAKQQCFIPTTILREHDLDLSEWLNGEPDERHVGVIKFMCDTAINHLAQARSLMGQLDKQVRFVFLELALVEPMISRVVAQSEQAISTPVRLSALQIQWHLLRGAMRKIP